MYIFLLFCSGAMPFQKYTSASADKSKQSAARKSKLTPLKKVEAPTSLLPLLVAETEPHPWTNVTSTAITAKGS